MNKNQINNNSILDNRTHFINYLIKKYNFKSYLEIGTSTGWNYNQIIVESKVGVDSDPNVLNWNFDDPSSIVISKSDDFFKHNEKTFDLIFIDGMHEKNQAYKDFKNSWHCLNDNGIILFHDIWPKNLVETEVYNMGNVFQLWMEICETYSYPSVYKDYYYGDALGIVNKSLEKNWIELSLKESNYNTFNNFNNNINTYIHYICINNNQRTILDLGMKEEV